MEILLINEGHPMWEKTIEFAKDCSWNAGSFLSSRMKENSFLPWERVVIAVEGDEIAGFCTIMEKDELPDEYDYSPFIGFVFVDEKYRGRRISEKMIDECADYARSLGYGTIYIMSGEEGLYEKYGFRKTGDFKTIYGWTDQLFYMDI